MEGGGFVIMEKASFTGNPRFVALIEESRRAYREQGGVSLDEVRRELGLPVKFVGVGETLPDLEVFDPDAFVDGLFG